MMDDQPEPVKGVNAILIIGAVILGAITIGLIAFALAGQTNADSGLLPLLATPTALGSGADEPPIALSFSELNESPLDYLNKVIQVSGEYTSLELEDCPRFSGPNLRWGLISEALLLEAQGYERIVKILQPGMPMTVQGIWRLYQGPLGCGKGPETGQAWFIEVQQIIKPNPIVTNNVGSSISVRPGGSELPSLQATATPPTTEATSPAVTSEFPILTATTGSIAATITLSATLDPASTPQSTPSPSATFAAGIATSTPGAEQPTATPGPSPTVTATSNPSDGGTGPGNTPPPPLTTATPGDPYPGSTATPSPTPSPTSPYP